MPSPPFTPSPHFTPSGEEIRRYRKLKRVSTGVSMALTVALLGAAVAFGWAEWWRDAVEDLTGVRAVGAAIFYAGLFVVLGALTSPVSLYSGLFLERRIGMSVQTLNGWLIDHAKGFAVGLVLGIAAAAAVYALLDAFPTTWWLIAGAGFSLVFVLLANLAPVLLLPIFFKFEPLPDGPVRDRLLNLCERVGVRAVNASVWKMSEKSRRSNAAVVGWGNTRRVIIADTMLDKYAPDEIEAVLAHELGHHVNRDIPLAILVQTALTFAGFFAIHIITGWLDGPLDLAGREDLAGMPLFGLVLLGVSFAALPAVNGFSRWREATADRFALRIIDDPMSFAGAMDKLAESNLAERNPGRLMEIIFHSHPSIASRIAAAGHAAALNRSGSPAGLGEARP